MPEPMLPPPGEQNGVDPESIQEIIALSVGRYVVVEFLVGTQNIVRREGVLTAVGNSWLVLYDENNGTSVVCDMYSVKFVTYFDPGARPDQRQESGGTRAASARGQRARRY
jgi:hypothetical protein